jgi:hypothetical protein
VLPDPFCCLTKLPITLSPSPLDVAYAHTDNDTSINSHGGPNQHLSFIPKEPTKVITIIKPDVAFPESHRPAKNTSPVEYGLQYH